MEYPEESVRKLLEQQGIQSDSNVVKELGRLFEEITADIASEADAAAKRAGRKTIGKEDVIAVKKKIL